MAKYVPIGSDYTHHVDFIVNGELVVPTTANVTVTNNAGSVVGSMNEQTITLQQGQTGADILIAAADNAVTLENELRYIIVTFTLGSSVYIIRDFYFLKENTQFPLDPADVLSVLGMTTGDIAADQVDILSAYQMVKDDAGEDVDTDAILATGSALMPYLILAVKYKAASFLSVGSQNSIMQMEQADNTLYKRFMEIDWDRIDRDISGLYANALWKLQGSPVTGSQTYSLMIAGTDAVTGEE